MAIEFNQTHHVVRTYQRAIRLPPSARQDAEQADHVGADQEYIHLIVDVQGATS